MRRATVAHALHRSFPDGHTNSHGQHPHATAMNSNNNTCTAVGILTLQKDAPREWYFQVSFELE